MVTQTNTQASSDPFDSFIGRESILERFEKLLRSAMPNRLRLLTIKGNSGTGKTTLIGYLSERVCPRLDWQSGTIIFEKSVPTFRYILNSLEDALKKCVSSDALKEYRTKREKCIESYNQSGYITINQNLSAQDHSAINTISQDVKVDLSEHERELQHRSNLTNLLVELAEQCEQPLSLFVDSYQRLQESSAELIDWFWKEAVLRVVQSSPQPVVVMTCGWDYPAVPSIEPYAEAMPPLEDFKRDEVKSYLEKQAVTLEEQQNELIDAFYGLTKGHPLVLSFAVAYFQELPPQEQDIDKLRAPDVLETIEAQTKFIQGRLLSQLDSPYNTLLQYGPVLRMFDQNALQALLQVEIEEVSRYEQTLDNQTYDKFLRYPFITQVGDNRHSGQRTFHDLIRSTQLDSLRTHHISTVEQLHRAMADYYLQLSNDEIDAASQTEGTPPSLSVIIPNIPERAFTAYLEHLYHAFQVREKREQAFGEWYRLTQAIIYAHCQQATELLEALRQHGEKSGQAEALLDVVTQLIKEGEEFFHETSNNYGHYLLVYSRFLEQEGNWQESQTKLQKALEIFQRTGNDISRALCLNNVGLLYRNRGYVNTATEYLERALAILRQEDDPGATALILNNLAVVYQEQNLTERSLRCLREALPILEDVRDPINFALVLNNIGMSYQTLGDLDTAFAYYKKAKLTAEAINDHPHHVFFLNNMGGIYQSKQRLALALEYYEAALGLAEYVGNVVSIAMVRSNIGNIYEQQNNWEKAALHYKMALPFFEKSDHWQNVASVLEKIAAMCCKLGEWEEALKYLESLRSLCEQKNNNAGLATALTSIGAIYWEQGQLEQTIQYYKQALPLFDEQDNLSGKVGTLYALGLLYKQQSLTEQALEYFDVARKLARGMSDTHQLRLCLNEMGLICLQRKQWKRAREYYEEVQSLLEHMHNPNELIPVLNIIGGLYCKQREWSQAFGHHEQALGLSEQMNDSANKAFSFYHLGEYCSERGEWELALDYHKRALAIREQIKSANDVIHSLNRIGFIYSTQEMWKDTLRCYERALKVAENEGHDATIALLLNNISGVYYAQSDIKQALHYCELALALKRKKTGTDQDSIDPTTLALLNNRGEIYRSQGNINEALETHQQVHNVYRQQNNHAGMAVSLNNMAGCYYAQGDMIQASECSQQANTACEDAGDFSILATCLNNMGSIHRSQGHIRNATRLYTRSYKGFEAVGSSGNAALTSHNLGIIYQQQQKMDMAIERHQRALDLYERLGHITDLIAIEELEILAQCYTQLNEPEKVAQYLARAQHAGAKSEGSSEDSRQPHALLLVPNTTVYFSLIRSDIYNIHFAWIDRISTH